tara:strand:+ start:687 stop:854 length:168 start_codon:yes stop_codon:yes gene_type:complete
MEKTAFELTPHEINVIRRALISYNSELKTISEFNPSFSQVQLEINDCTELLEIIK